MSEKQKEILISVVIPVKNGEKTIEACLNGIREQTIYHKTEIILIDSGSTDDTLQIIKKHDDINLYLIKSEEFNHGETRNFGVSKAKGNFVVLTVQDAVATHNNWLEQLIRHFDDEKVAAVCGQQVVPENKFTNPLEWHRPINPPGIRNVKLKSKMEYEKMSPLQRKKICSWDNVNAAYRKSVLVDLPFERVSFGEDSRWARAALFMGYILAYDDFAKVYHYHHANYNYQIMRTFTVLNTYYKNFGLMPEKPKVIKHFLRVSYRMIKLRLTPYWFIHNYKKSFASIKAHLLFIHHLKKGDEQLQIAHNKICKLPPQGTVKI